MESWLVLRTGDGSFFCSQTCWTRCNVRMVPPICTVITPSNQCDVNFNLKFAQTSTTAPPQPTYWIHNDPRPLPITDNLPVRPDLQTLCNTLATPGHHLIDLRQDLHTLPTILSGCTSPSAGAHAVDPDARSSIGLPSLSDDR